MGAKKEVTHEITVRIKFDRPVYRKDAAYAAWNNLDGQELWGADDAGEPWGQALVMVRKNGS